MRERASEKLGSEKRIGRSLLKEKHALKKSGEPEVELVPEADVRSEPEPAREALSKRRGKKRKRNEWQ